MTKVVLTKPQADAVERLLSLVNNKPRLIKEKIEGGWRSGGIKEATTIHDYDFIEALYNGYQVKKTEDELLVEAILKKDEENREWGSGDWSRGYDDGWRNAVNFVLGQLGKPTVKFTN